MEYKAVKFVKRPEEVITPDVFEVVTLTTPDLQEGEFLVKQTHMSLDPAMRGWMDEDFDGYVEPIQIGEIMRSFGLGVVVESRNPDFPKDSRVVGIMGWTEYALSNGEGLQIVPKDLPPDLILSVLYIPGLTAYLGLMEVAKPKPGETLVVSGAAGSVGSIAGQIGKAEGLQVIGVAGSDEKCQWLEKELGFDKAVNYKTADLEKAIAEATPNGVDIYFENTGGPIQQMVFNRMNHHGRISVCGMIADYNTNTPSPGPNWIDINLKRLRVQGFIVIDYEDKFSMITEKLTEYLQKGQIKYRSHTIEGLESAIEGINLLFSGKNKGKLIVEL